MKRNNYYDDAIQFKSLYKALKKCCNEVRWKDSVVGYEANALKNTYNLRQDLLNGNYKISKYQTFTIYEPKQREIVATRIRDRQYQRAVCDSGFIEDITEHFVIDNPACQKNKGTSFTFDRLKKSLRKYYCKYGNKGWVLKCDIKHFFPNTKHSVAIASVGKRCEDEKVFKAVCDVINSFEQGLGLGSEISQLVELAVLDDLDHFIKEQLHIECYIRTMDDFVLVHPNKEHLQYCKQEIDKHLNRIGLEFNKKTQLIKLEKGFYFMKWKFCITDSGKVLMLVDRHWITPRKKHLKKIIKKEISGELPIGTAKASLDAMVGYISQGNTVLVQNKLTKWFRETEADLWLEQTKSYNREEQRQE